MDFNNEKYKSLKNIKRLKNILPKSGSYDFNNNFNLNEKNGTTIELKETRLSSHKHHNHNIGVAKKPPSSKFTTMHDSTFNTNSKLFGKMFPKYRRTLAGIPILCLTYFSAIYTMLSYTAISVLSIYQIVYGEIANMYPLYLLVIGYIAMAFMSFLLIIAIFKEMLNFVACWIIIISVYILPEIGLNILLANNSLNWFSTDIGFYTLVILIVRISFNLPCIFLILIYHVNATKKRIYLKNLITPLKDSIINGEVLKIYNSIKIDNFELPPDIYHSLPNHLTTANATEATKSPNFTHKFPVIKNTGSVTFSDQTAQPKSNTFFYKMSPNQHYSIHLKPSEMTDAVDSVQSDQTLNETNILKSNKNNYDLNALHLVWGDKRGRTEGNQRHFDYDNNLLVNSASGANLGNMNNFEYFKKMQHKYNHQNEMDSNQNPIFKIPFSAHNHENPARVMSYFDHQDHQFYSLPYEDPVAGHHSNEYSDKKLVSLSNHQIYLPPPSLQPPTSLTQSGRHHEDESYVRIARSFQI